jgi:simple sugar transport system ATP-binding protein
VSPDISRKVTDNAPILRLDSIGKQFGTTSVLTNISLSVRMGEVLCLLGDNGAGKSTLIKILSGFHQPSAGSIHFEGQVVSFRSPREAAQRGIATVHQFGGTFPLMTIAGAEPTKGWGPLRRFDRKRSAQIAVNEMQALGITRVDDGNRLVGGLSGGERQALAIGRAVHFGASVLILDEPTAALGVKEAAHVLRIIMQARQRGVAVVLVTHNVTHAMTVGDHFAVLIRGEVADDFRKGERTREQITDLMAGGEAMADLEAEIAAFQLSANKQAGLASDPETDFDLSKVRNVDE